MIAGLILAATVLRPQEDQQFPMPTANELEQAVQIYRRFGLPLPPRNAQLIAIPHKDQSSDGGGTNYEFGFRYADPKTGRPVFLVELRVRSVDEDRASDWPIGVEKAVPVNFEQLMSLEPSFYEIGRMFEASASLAFAIQLASLGDTEPAKRFTQINDSAKWFSPKTTLVRRTYVLVADFLEGQYVDPKGDADSAARRLRALYVLVNATEPKFMEDDGVMGYGTVAEELSRGIVEATSPTKLVSTGDERLVDDLTQYGAAVWFQPHCFEDPAARALLERGKAIIPTLIAHMDDQRATRAWLFRRDNTPPNTVRIGDVCQSVVDSLATNTVDNKDWLKKSEAEDWWSQVKDMDEEPLLESAMYSRKGLDWNGKDKTDVPLETAPLMMYAFRFPGKLADLYLKSLDWKFNSNEQLAKLISDSGLSKSKKVQLFKAAAERGSAVHQDVAAKYLKKYDPAAALDMLRTLLKQDDPFGPGYEGDLRASDLSARVIDCKDEETAHMLVAAAERKDVGTRMNVIQGIVQSGRSGKTGSKGTAIKALSEFLRDLEKWSDDDGANRTVPYDVQWLNVAISVRDYAAYGIGRMIDFPLQPQRAWTTQQWEYYADSIEDKIGG